MSGSSGLTIRRVSSALLALLLALPPGGVGAAPSGGTIQGVVRLEGRPLAGVTVAFIHLESGAVVRATSGEDGTFSAVAPTGEYAVTTESQAGLAVGQAPVRVTVADGLVSTADVDLVAVASAMPQEPGAAGQVPPPPPAEGAAGEPQAGPVWAETTGTGAQILFEPVTCFVAGEFPLLDASIEPVSSVARARVYFRGAVGNAFYYVEMAQDAGRYFGKLPRPRVEASPITYYMQSTTTAFEESQTREIEAIVVENRDDCGDRKVAAYGPSGPVTVFSAATGAATDATGFFAVAASSVLAGVAAVLAITAAAAGIVGGISTGPPGGPSPPPPVVAPSPIPVPTPLPPPTPPPPVTAFR